ncbi:MAG: hypothetical protein A2Y80_06400 [Deltaproteobacteria bacterium RBG_13_58_19]|nr:MAG: hypothetical protein A2Y80_06400 [Deltaproteobacteria bacterium RBG_13_58_19]
MSVRVISRRYTPAGVIIKLLDGSIIKGKINVAGADGTHRVSDLFVLRKDQFIVLTEVESGEIPGKVLIINKDSIMWVVPEEKREEKD